MIELNLADGIAEVVLNAPEKMNALNAEALAELEKAYDDAATAASRGEVRAQSLLDPGPKPRRAHR